MGKDENDVFRPSPISISVDPCPLIYLPFNFPVLLVISREIGSL